MKKLLLTIISIISLTPLFVGSMAHADSAIQFSPSSTPVNQVGGCDGAAASSSVCTEIKSTGNPLFGPTGILTKVAQIFAMLTGIIAVFMIITSGLRYVTSGGDPAKTATARKGIMYSAIGVAVAMSAGIIAQFVIGKL